MRQSPKSNPLKYNEEGLTGPYVIEQIYKVTEGNAIITTDVGQHQMWAAQYYRYKDPRTFLSSGGLGTMVMVSVLQSEPKWADRIKWY